MPVNSYKIDEQSSETGKLKTLFRLLSYLMVYKKEILFVLLIMAFCVTVSLLNPLIMEEAVDRFISAANQEGLWKLIGFSCS